MDFSITLGLLRSSSKYNICKDGSAMIIRIGAGSTVHTISIVFPNKKRFVKVLKKRVDII